MSEYEPSCAVQVIIKLFQLPSFNFWLLGKCSVSGVSPENSANLTLSAETLNNSVKLDGKFEALKQEVDIEASVQSLLAAVER